MPNSCLRRQKLWKSVLFELRIASSLLVFFRSELDRPWHARASIVDASLSGYSVAERQPDVELTRAVGEWDERWRFRRDMDIGARERFALAELSELATARPCAEGPVTGSALVEADFLELPDVFVDENNGSRYGRILSSVQMQYI